jgi:hypothetical protein
VRAQPSPGPESSSDLIHQNSSVAAPDCTVAPATHQGLTAGANSSGGGASLDAVTRARAADPANSNDARNHCLCAQYGDRRDRPLRSRGADRTRPDDKSRTAVAIASGQSHDCLKRTS